MVVCREPGKKRNNDWPRAERLLENIARETTSKRVRTLKGFHD